MIITHILDLRFRGRLVFLVECLCSLRELLMHPALS